MFPYAHPANIIHGSTSLSGREELCFYLIPRTFEYVSVRMLIRPILFMEAHFYLDVEIYVFTFYRERSNLCFPMLIRPILFMEAYSCPDVEIQAFII